MSLNLDANTNEYYACLIWKEVWASGFTTIYEAHRQAAQHSSTSFDISV